MRYRPLGDSQLNVSVITFGAWQLGDPEYWGADAETDAEATVRCALEAGVNLFDTAEMYGDGESERILGKALGVHRDEVLIATKVMPQNCAPEKLRASCEASLKRLGTDRIDLYQVHWRNRDIPVEETCGEMARLRDEGKIRFIGVSNFGKNDVADWLVTGEAVSDQIGYNMLFRAPEYAVIPACRRNGIGVLAYMPLLQGILSGKYRTVDAIPPVRRRTRHFASSRANVRHGEPGCESILFETVSQLSMFTQYLSLPLPVLALSWLLCQPGVTSAVLGARKPEQLADNLAAARVVVDPASMAMLNEITGVLKSHLGPNPDLWQSGENSRIR